MAFKKRIGLQKWSNTVAVLTCFIYTSISLVLISFLVPACMCADAYLHLSVLPPVYLLAYMGILSYNLTGVVASVVVIRQIGQKQSRCLLLFLVLSLTTELAILATTSFILIVSTRGLVHYEQFVIDAVQGVVLKDEVKENVNDLMVAFHSLIRIMKTDMNLDDDAMTIQRLMEVFLKPEVVVLSKSALNALSAWAIFQMIFLNVIFSVTVAIIYLYCRSLVDQKKIAQRLPVSEITLNQLPGDDDDGQWQAILSDGRMITMRSRFL